MRGLLGRLLQGGDQPRPPGKDLAAAALLVEAARADGRFGAEERKVIEHLLRDRLGVEPGHAATLLAEAEQASAAASDWQGFTRVLIDAHDEPARVELIEMLWEVVEADGQVDMLEAALMRRLPALLYVPDRVSFQARQRARVRLGLPESPAL